MPKSSTKFSALSLVLFFSFQQLFGNVSTSNSSEQVTHGVLLEASAVFENSEEDFIAEDDRSLQADQMNEDDPDDVDSSSYFDTDENAKDPRSPLPESLYNPNMNYGTGAPVPKKEPLSTKKKNLMFFLASVIMASVAMSIVSSGSGNPAPGTTTP